MKLTTITVILLALMLVLCAGCRTKNVGDEGPVLTVTFVPATTWVAGATATLTVDWGATGTAPFTIEAAMGGGTTANVAAGTAATSPYTNVFTLVEGGPFTYSVNLTDGAGNVGTFTGTYTVGPSPNATPTIDDVTYAAGVLTVTVSDADGDTPLTVAVTDVAGLAVDNTSLAADATGVAVFNWTADDMFAGGTGSTDITVTDGTATSAATAQTITVDAVVITVDAGALAAVPMQETAAVGETVTVLVIAGDFPAAAAFNYMNGCAVTTPDGGDFVDDTLNVGAVGGAQKDSDGIWGTMSPLANTFFLPENFMMKAADVAADGTLDYMGFNITPIGAGEVTGGGTLFNFGIAFDAAGTYQLGFLEFQDVKRTYYSDNAAVEYNWTDISNDYAGVPNAVTVN